MKEKQDIFDWMMRWRLLRPFRPYYLKYKEILLYLFFGGLSFVVSISSYAFFEYIMHCSPLIANIFSWVLAVSFAYITNRTWVFEKTASYKKSVVREIGAFFGGRVLTLIIEELILLVGIELLGGQSLLVKVIAQVVVIVLNYFLSKFWIFKSKE